MTPHTLDIRDISHAKGEPFTSIMAAINALGPGQALLLIAPFKPEPLLHLLDSRGFDNEATSSPDGIWQVLFRPRPLAEPETDAADPLTWPKPTVLVDLSSSRAEDTADAVLAALADMEMGRVLFAVLVGEPADLRDRLFNAGHSCFGRWQESTYRIMVLRGALSANEPVQHL